MLNLYLISPTDKHWPRDYDVFLSAVVAAKDEKTARETHPSGKNDEWKDTMFSVSWVTHPDQVKVKWLGVAGTDTEPGVVLASCFRHG